ncbi:hypothetical protein L207DRAFT_571820, partial [Hyaloscypha variabilis F]
SPLWPLQSAASCCADDSIKASHSPTPSSIPLLICSYSPTLSISTNASLSLLAHPSPNGSRGGVATSLSKSLWQVQTLPCHISARLAPHSFFLAPIPSIESECKSRHPQPSITTTTTPSALLHHQLTIISLVNTCDSDRIVRFEHWVKKSPTLKPNPRAQGNHSTSTRRDSGASD